MFDLIKFCDEKYVSDLLDGKLFMNTLGYFWNNGFEGQKDFTEGTDMLSQPQDVEFIYKEFQDAIIGNVGWRREVNKYINLYCLYKLNRYDDQIEQIDKRINNFGKVAIHITNVDAFIIRIMKGMKQYQNSLFCCGDVHYYAPFICPPKSEMLDCFNKPDYLSYQKEWRLAILANREMIAQLAANSPSAQYVEPIILNIGNIRDISRVIATEDLLNHADTYFRGSKIVEKVNRKVMLTPQIADQWFAKGFAFPRSALDGAYWGNCDRVEFNRSITAIAPDLIKPYFVIG